MSRVNTVSDETAVEAASVLEEKIHSAAIALAEADVVLLVTGAGWSADSGLPVYADIAEIPAYQLRGLNYADVSRPLMIEKDPALFYGFWGQALHDYRHTVPHSGYDIVTNLRRDKMQSKVADLIRERVKSKLEQRRTSETSVEPSIFGGDSPYVTPFDDLPIKDMAGSFYCLTSNCDAHFYDFLPMVDIHDIHGNIELWQCSDRDCVESGIWRAPANWSIAVNPETLEAPPVADLHTKPTGVGDFTDNICGTPRLGQSQGIGMRKNLLQFMAPGSNKISWDGKNLEDDADESPNWPKCDKCKSLARPSIFMFGDFGWKYDHAQNARWNAWREGVVELCSESPKSLKVCILEIGCGKNVPTCRSISEILLEDLIKTGFGDDARLVRINPDLAEADHAELSDYVVSIQSKGLAALRRIQAIYATHI